MILILSADVIQFLHRYKQRKLREQIAPGVFDDIAILFRIFPAGSGVPSDLADESPPR